MNQKTQATEPPALDQNLAPGDRDEIQTDAPLTNDTGSVQATDGGSVVVDDGTKGIDRGE